MKYTIEFGIVGSKSLIFRSVAARGREDAVRQARKLERELQRGSKEKKVFFYGCRRARAGEAGEGVIADEEAEQKQKSARAAAKRDNPRSSTKH